MPSTLKKLKQDAIVEGLCELRFESEESRTLPELILGKVAQFDIWKGFQKIRLPFADVPAELRAQDPNLKNQPTLELRDPNGHRLAKIGSNVFSYHRMEPYPGWENFKPEIDDATRHLFGALENLVISRIGFRYINVFNDAKHGVSSTNDLNYTVKLAGNELTIDQNINYRVKCSDEHMALVRIASQGFVSGPFRGDIGALLDIDVYTPDDWKTSSLEETLGWIETAHDFEKQEFEKLLTPELIKRLVETE